MLWSCEDVKRVVTEVRLGGQIHYHLQSDRQFFSLVSAYFSIYLFSLL